MPDLLALDIAILPPADATARAIALSAALPEAHSEGLRLDGDHLPHITLVQMFVRENELETAFERADGVLRAQPAFPVAVLGAGSSGQTVWLEIERTRELVALHERLMEELRGVERQNGGPAAFYEGEGRVADVVWVTGYRLKSSLERFTPHITLGHAPEPPAVEPFSFEASAIAACHLGRFCTCRRVLRRWTLPPAGR